MDRSRCGGRDWFLATDDADVLLRRRMCRGSRRRAGAATGFFDRMTGFLAGGVTEDGADCRAWRGEKGGELRAEACAMRGLRLIFASGKQESRNAWHPRQYRQLR